ncbi:hypothetical protein [Dyella sp. RRB7]|uniref:hypothetical protein n=1 Tax=Dyella sp. RRB7 TaxID=2919502 RepID=UPI001FAA59B0|nr:hypothetical protein [Dyella sp. RRB7]
MTTVIHVAPVFLALALAASTAGATCWQPGVGAPAVTRHPSVAEEYQQAQFVVIGRAVRERNVFSVADTDDYDWTVYDVEVMKAFKGNPPHIIHLLSENSSARFPMDTGKSYLLFITHMPMVEREGDETLPADFVDNCGHSSAMEAAGENLTTVSRLSEGH